MVEIEPQTSLSQIVSITSWPFLISRAVEVALGEVRDAPVVVGIGVFGIDLDRLVEVGDGAVLVALAVVRNTSVVVGLGIFRIEPDRLVVFGDGAVAVAR